MKRKHQLNSDIIQNYEDFILNNRIKVNKWLNYVLWTFSITGPAIALGIKSGFFLDVAYSTCIGISVVMIITAFVHLVLLKMYPNSVATSFFALIAVDLLLVYMAINYVSIYITWFLVPLLSIMLCDRYLYLSAVLMNYLFMLASTWVTAPYYASFHVDSTRAAVYFFNRMGGFTIETVVMMISGQIVNRLAIEYYKNIFEQHKIIKNHEAEMRKELDILDSMVEVYDNVNLLNFYDNTEMSLRDIHQKKHSFDLGNQTHTLMNQRIMTQVMPDQIDDFLKFTDIQTVRSRLANKKIISADFIDIVHGWFRAQYISADGTVDGIPNLIIYTTRNVDEEKRREEHLLRLSLTDELTRIYNRRCYDEDLDKLNFKDISDTFVIFAIDVNGLKKINDTKGHAAGDELIKGAAECLALSIRSSGKVYRTGGDEFMAIVDTEDPESINNDIRKRAKEWWGVYSSDMTLSIGFASKREFNNASISELERIADSRMYEDKERYYREMGLDRRR